MDNLDPEKLISDLRLVSERARAEGFTASAAAMEEVLRELERVPANQIH